MADRTVDPVYVPVTVSTPAGTMPAAPLTTAVTVPLGTLESIDLQIPGGHGGQTGIRFALAGQQIVPWSNTAAWIIGDALDRVFDVGIETGTGLTIITYNTGQYAHQHLVRFKVRQAVTVTARPTTQLVPLDQLQPGAP